MNKVGLSALNQVGTRYYSTMNPWIDFAVYAPKNAVPHITKRIREAMNAYWEGEFDTYGDALEHALRNTVVFIVYHDADNEDDAYEAAWEAMLAETEIAVVIDD